MERVPLLKSELERIVRKNKGHIIVTTACIGGEVSSNILEMEKARANNDLIAAEAAKQRIIDFVLWAKELFGSDFYFEVAPAKSKEQIIVNKKMVELSACFGVKIVLGCDAHYLRKKDRYVHEAFLNSHGGERETAQFYEYTYLQTEEEIKENLRPSIVDMYEQICKNSMEIFDKIEVFNLHHAQRIPKKDVENYPKRLPEQTLSNYPKLSKMFMSDDKIERYWINKCISKLKEIDKYNDTYLAELEEEAEIKEVVGNNLQTNMFSYPVTLSRYIDMFWDLGSTVGAGRGSACSGLNHYLLGITQLDPLEWNFPFYRYMNRETKELGDIDIDLAPSKIEKIISAIKKERGANFDEKLELTPIEKENLGCVYVGAFGTETSKSAILTSCRGYRGSANDNSTDWSNGIDSDTAQYLSSLISVERGFVDSISDTYYGNEQKGKSPQAQFVREIDSYEGLLQIALGIEGLISKKTRHASGVLFLDEDPYECCAFMKAPSGEVITQFDLHDAEWLGATKFDLLVTEIQDKIIQTLQFLQSRNFIEPTLTLREAYNKYLSPDVLPIDNQKYWKPIQEASVLDLFQLDSDVGRQGAKKVRPTNMIELSSTNGLIRLMNAEKGEESWLDKYVRYKNNPKEYEKDIARYHLTKEERNAVDRYVKITNGIGISQEQFMKTVMDKDICNFSLKDANAARKIISKKKMKEIPKLREKVFSTCKSQNLAQYVWDFIVAPGLGYSFSDIHSLSYSFIGFQSAYLSTNWNSIYWNAACLIVNSGSLEDEEDEEEIVDIYETEDPEYEYEDLPDRSGKKKKAKSTDYGKVAKAIGQIRSNGIKVSLVDINNSNFGFDVDDANNTILFGLKGLTKVNDDVIKLIVSGRPYAGIKDFMTRCPLNKSIMLSLIKGGAFDKVDNEWASKICPDAPRRAIMAYYISLICEPKTKITLQNLNGLVKKNIIPTELKLLINVYEFNKYLKTKKKGYYYVLDEACLSFLLKNFGLDEVESQNNLFAIKQTTWDKMYKTEMDKMRNWMTQNQTEILNDYNAKLFEEEWKKDASGSISAWEMETCCFYYHEHELANVDTEKYGISNYFDLPEEPEVDYFFKRGGREIPIFKLHKIIGTVLCKNDTKSTISLLTTQGVVNVKFSKEYYANFKKQISRKNNDGTKTIIEKSWFRRGCKLMLTGYRTGDTFRTKAYKNTPTHQLYLIEDLSPDGKEMILRHERAEA